MYMTDLCTTSGITLPVNNHHFYPQVIGKKATVKPRDFYRLVHRPKPLVLLENKGLSTKKGLLHNNHKNKTTLLTRKNIYFFIYDLSHFG